MAQCDDCKVQIGGTFFEGGRDPKRVKTCSGSARHNICSKCHGGWRSECPVCGSRFR
jgi:hypothetical protein